MLSLTILFLFIGGLAGLLAGLFGIGGGVILVPTLTLVFSKLGFPIEKQMHLVLGTSLSCIIITCLNSSRTHLKRTPLDKPVFFNISLGIIIGAFSGGLIANKLSSFQLKAFFATFLILVTIKMLLNLQMSSKDKKVPKPLYWFIGTIIGLKSSLLGVGGGTLSVPFLSWTGKKMHEAVAISSTIGIPISVIGTLSFIYTGSQASSLPEYTLGFVYLPAFIGISSATIFSARVGANLSHDISHERLKFFFKIFLIILVAKSLYNLFR